jgi:hypothetical protein
MFTLGVRFDLAPANGAAFDALVDETLGILRAREPRTVIDACHAAAGDQWSRECTARLATRR